MKAHKTLETKFLKLPVEDNLRPQEINKLTKLLPTTILQIQQALDQQKTVLVHCKMGRQRSAAIAAAYLIFKDHLTPEQAILKLKHLKGDVFEPEPNFLNSLVAYHEYLNK